ncbi:trypsin-like serine peptidase [Staphylococcus borealis]|uniref:trypsin-like serine peptidase n=1 Tax=Staphylococcus borealis TaxID=2742203 RepID=UPI00211B822A|nr:trypsin-like peptidase domain-containing protein [Staphylococcus borealis]MCQ9278794.1 trypsin-like peptidase domain-containing protein [Staphylococcus borealis]
MTVVLSFLFQLNDAHASTKSKDLSVQPTSQQHNPVKGAKGNVATTQAKVQTPSKVTNRNQASLQKTMAPSKRAHVTSTHVTPKSTKAQPSSQNVSKQKQPTKVNKKVVSTNKKPQNASKITRAQSAKPQLLAQTTKTKSKPITKVAVVSKTKTAKPSTQTSVKTSTKASSTAKKNYYNQAPKRWPSNVPGGDNVRDFGQTTKESGIDDALKIMKKSGNKGVTIEHAKAKDANIATVYNWNPKAKQLTYGTGTAIGKHTILTANHVVNDQSAHKPLTPSQPQNMRINILQEGSKIVRTLEVFGVQMLQYGDVSLVYTYEDISKYMKIRKIASENSIKAMKANTPIHMYHYGKPTGKYKNDPAGTMYHSKGKYTMTARNVNPIGYYQMMAEPGSSGGAVLNSKNEVIGIHAFRLNSGDYKKYNLNTMAEIRGKLRKEIIDNIV